LIFNGLTAVSLTLCAAVATLAVHLFSYLGFSFAFAPTGHGQEWIIVGVFPRTLNIQEGLFSSGTWTVLPSKAGFHPWDDGARLEVLSATGDAGGPCVRFALRHWEIPLWYVVLLTAIIPGVRLLTYLKREAFARGFCPQCGYDLRATPDRCPECGTIPPKREMISKSLRVDDVSAKISGRVGGTRG
jgi:hypothetical protein